MFGRLLGWYIIYTFSGALAPWQNFARCKIHFTSKSCVRLHWPRYCTALQQRASAKLCGVVGLQEMELRNFRRRRHLCSAGRPSRLASAHILVYRIFCLMSLTLIHFYKFKCNIKRVEFSQYLRYCVWILCFSHMRLATTEYVLSSKTLES